MGERDLALAVGRSEYTNKNRLIHSGPCIVKDITIAGDGANGDCQVYDGLNDAGKQKTHLEALSGTTFSWTPGNGTDFDYGIYIAVNAATTKVTVTYIPESRKDFI
jgi:hypothetical protein